MNPPREVNLEEYLIDSAESMGGYAFKLAPLSFVGLPDRLVVLPGGKAGFIETKRTRRDTPRKNQTTWLNRLRALGFVADWCADRDAVDIVLQRIRDL